MNGQPPAGVALVVDDDLDALEVLDPVSYTHLDVYKRQALDYGRAHDVVVRPRTPQPVHLDGDPFPAVDEARWRVAASELIVLTRGPN